MISPSCLAPSSGEGACKRSQGQGAEGPGGAVGD